MDRIVAAIDSHRPDVLVVNELRARTAPDLRARLSEAGLVFDRHTGPVGFEGGTLVASRYRLRRLPPSGPSALLRHAFIEVEIPKWGVIGAVYGPMLTKAHGRFWNRLARHGADRVKRSYLLIGDFNTGEAGVDAYKKPFAGSDQFMALKSAGFVDLWRDRNADTEHTWFSFGRGGVPLNGFRIDHALASPSLARNLSACRYSHIEREERLSDHSILVVDFSNSVR